MLSEVGWNHFRAIKVEQLPSNMLPNRFEDRSSIFSQWIELNLEEKLLFSHKSKFYLRKSAKSQPQLTFHSNKTLTISIDFHLFSQFLSPFLSQFLFLFLIHCVWEKFMMDYRDWIDFYIILMEQSWTWLWDKDAQTQIPKAIANRWKWEICKQQNFTKNY